MPMELIIELVKLAAALAQLAAALNKRNHSEIADDDREKEKEDC